MNINLIKTKKNSQTSAGDIKGRERGGASVIAIFFMLFVVVVTTSSVLNRYRETRTADASRVRLREEWAAKSAVAAFDRVIQTRLPAQNLRDLEYAQTTCNAALSLEAFDAQDVTSVNSRPVAIITPAPLATTCGNYGGAAYTSLLGNLDAYLKARTTYLQTELAALGYTSDDVRLGALSESVRRFTPGLPPVFQIHYVLDSRGGRTGAVRSEGDVVLGTISQTCGTTATMTADRAQIYQGESLTLTITYSMATNLKIYETGGGTLIHEATVTENSNPQTYDYTFAPTASNSYRVDATGATGGCASQSATVAAQVSSPNVCAVNPPQISNYTASSLLVNAGEDVNLGWQITGGAQSATLNGAAVALIQNNHVARINADTVFTLVATDDDASGDCPAQQQITVSVRPPAACALPTPTVAFTADQTSIQTGQSATLTWNVGAVEAGGSITFTEADGQAHALSASGADTRIFNQPGTYVYKVTARNVCPDGTVLTKEETVTITVTIGCSVPVIPAFSANPNSVIAGGNQTVRLAWSLSGTVDSISISGIGAVSGSFIDIAQPQTTTAYTLTITGCGQSQSATTNIVVNAAAGRQYAEVGGSAATGNYTRAQARAEIASNPDGRISIEIVVYESGRLDFLEVRQNGTLLKRFNNINEYFAIGVGGNKFVPLVPFDPNQTLTIYMQVTSSINAGGIVETSVLNASSANRSLPNSCIYYNGFSSPMGNFTCGYEGTNLSYVVAPSIASY